MGKLIRIPKLLTLQKFKSAQLWFYLLIYALFLLMKQGLTLPNDKVNIFDGGYTSLVNCIPHDSKYTCDCHNVNQRLLLPRLTGFVFHVEIKNCKSLAVEANSLEDTQGLRKITMQNIDRLLLKQYALAFPRYASNTPLVIEFEKVNFEAIESHAIIGNIEEISFLSGSIDILHPFSFTTLKDRALLLKMDNLWIKKIESQAFKKFAVEEMDISNCVFGSNVPSKAFYEIEVLNSLHLYNNKFRTIHSHAFSFKLINKLFIVENSFEAVDAEWFEAYVKESIVIRNNYFGITDQIAFKGLHIHKDYVLNEQMELPFVNNSLKHSSAELTPLDFDHRFVINLKTLKYDNIYQCRWVDMKQKPIAPISAFFRTHMDSIYFLPETGVKASGNHSHIALNQLIQTQCRPRSYTVLITCIVVGIIVLLLIAALIAWFIWRRKRKQRKLDVVLPEPRTYKETQIVYQIENAGLLKTDL